MNAHQMVLVTIALSVTLIASSCGGSDGGAGNDVSQTESAPAAHAIPARIVSQADRNCRWMLRSVKHVAGSVDLADYTSGLQLTTEAFAKPGIKLVKGLEKRQNALRTAAADPRFDAYVELFDPIVVLGEQRLEAGLDNDRARSEYLQDLLTDLGKEQGEAAARAGLRACDVDFLDVLVREAFD
jgi:hypothetical protein